MGHITMCKVTSILRVTDASLNNQSNKSYCCELLSKKSNEGICCICRSFHSKAVYQLYFTKKTECFGLKVGVTKLIKKTGLSLAWPGPLHPDAYREYKHQPTQVSYGLQY